MTNGNQTYIANGFVVWDSH